MAVSQVNQTHIILQDPNTISSSEEYQALSLHVSTRVHTSTPIFSLNFWASRQERAAIMFMIPFLKMLDYYEKNINNKKSLHQVTDPVDMVSVHE